MRNRFEILKQLSLHEGDIELLKEELSNFPWDIEKPLYKISREDFSNVLKRGVNNEIS